MAALADVRKKWHIPPAFSVEFIGYYLDRISRLKEIKVSLQDQLELNKKLVDEQQVLREQYEEVSDHFFSVKLYIDRRLGVAHPQDQILDCKCFFIFF